VLVGLSRFMSSVGGVVNGFRRPIKWRQAVVTFACVYPTSLLLSAVVPQLTSGWPRPLSTALTAALLVAALTWILLPVSGRLTRGWITGSRRRPGQDEPGGPAES